MYSEGFAKTNFEDIWGDIRIVEVGHDGRVRQKSNQILRIIMLINVSINKRNW
jgi:hypothetical protein